VLLLRTEIQHALAIKPNDCTVVKELMENMQLALDHRIPITELYIVAAIHCVSKNDTDVAHYNFNAHQLISLIFGTYIAV